MSGEASIRFRMIDPQDALNRTLALHSNVLAAPRKGKLNPP
jgi:hypothetical protein